MYSADRRNKKVLVISNVVVNISRLSISELLIKKKICLSKAWNYAFMSKRILNEQLKCFTSTYNKIFSIKMSKGITLKIKYTSKSPPTHPKYLNAVFNNTT